MQVLPNIQKKKHNWKITKRIAGYLQNIKYFPEVASLFLNKDYWRTIQ